MRSIQTNPMIFMSDRLSVAFSFSRRAHLLTTCKAGGGISFGNRALCEADAAPAGALWPMPHPAGLLSLSTQSARDFRFGSPFYGRAIRPPILPPACENLPPAVLSQSWVRHVL